MDVHSVKLGGGILRRLNGDTEGNCGVFYPIFAAFMVLVVLYIAATVLEYGLSVSAGNGRAILFFASVVLLGIAVWWMLDAFGRVPPTTGVQVARAVVFLFAAGPVLSDPVRVRVAERASEMVRSIGRVRRLIWRPAAILSIVMFVLWFLS